MQKLSTDLILARIAEREGTKNDTELGAVLGGKARSTVSNWRKRNTVPVEEIAEYCLTNKISFDWVFTGRTTIDNDAQPMAVAVAVVRALHGKPLPKDEKIAALMRAVATRWPIDEQELNELIALVI